MDFKKKIEITIKNLLNDKPFYAHFFLNSRVVYDRKDVPTAAATITRKGPMLIFNSQWMGELTVKECAAVVEHEILHLLFEHVFVHKRQEDINHHIANIAMDCAINQFIQDLPAGCVHLADLNKGLGLKMDEKETWEYYYWKLLQKKEELGETDSHDKHDFDPGEDGEGQGKTMSSQEAKAALRETTDKAIKQAKGNVPQNVLKVYEDMIASPKLPWQQILSNFVARSISTVTQNTRKKINRRFGIEQPGKKKKRELVLGVCVDSSGSVSDEAFQSFLGEVQRIAQVCSKTYLIDADCEVQSVEVIKKNGKIKTKREGGGGTAYQPAIDEARKLGCDAIVYFGDMDAADTPENPGVPFLWVIVGSQKPPGDFGTTLNLDV